MIRDGYTEASWLLVMFYLLSQAVMHRSLLCSSIHFPTLNMDPK